MEQIVRFLFELGQLKRVARSGWWMAGVRSPESVADHSFRCAWIGYLLAQRHGGADAARVTLMCLMNDLHEARINDLHKVGQAYLDYTAAETRAFRDLAAPLPEGAQLTELHLEFQRGETIDARLARDADRLECAFQAREYEAAGCPACRDWFENTRVSLATPVARELFEALARADVNEWWRGLPRAK
ncbi:MAG: HD domain-containing protein [Candidatus Eisenbacteria bacterium]